MGERFYRKTWFVILLMVLFPPMGLILMWLYKKNWNTILKILLSIVLAFNTLVMIAMLSPTSDEQTVDSDTATSSLGITQEAVMLESITQEETTLDSTTEESTTAAATTAKKPTPTTQKQAAATTEKPAPTTEKQTTKKPAPTTEKQTTKKPVITTQDPNERITVYRTSGGEKYHYENPCGNGEYYPVSLADALRSGLEPCEKCVLH